MAEYINPIIGAFILFSIGLVTLYLKNRIKNLASSHDIKELTRKTEEVKKEFADKTEELKAQLSFATQYKLTVKKYETEALFDYNKKLLSWIINLIKYDFYNYNYSVSSVNKNFRTLQNLKKELVFSESHLELFITDSDFETSRDKLKSIADDFETIKFNLARKFCNDVTSFYSEQMESINPADEFAVEEHYRNYNLSVTKFKDKEPDEYKRFLKMTQVAFRNYKIEVNRILKSIEQPK